MVWLQFLQGEMQEAVSRPFIDFFDDGNKCAEMLRFYSDATAKFDLGFGCIFNESWMYYQWDLGFVKKYEPNIEFLELFAICECIFTWESRLNNQRVVVFCDNEVVVNMNNNTTSGCKFCMTLI